jgi:hypothetical protein
MVNPSNIQIMLHTYTRDSFLFRTINKCLREEDYSTIETLGPSICLLNSCYQKNGILDIKQLILVDFYNF